MCDFYLLIESGVYLKSHHFHGTEDKEIHCLKESGVAADASEVIRRDTASLATATDSMVQGISAHPDKLRGATNRERHLIKRIRYARSFVAHTIFRSDLPHVRLLLETASNRRYSVFVLCGLKVDDTFVTSHKPWNTISCFRTSRQKCNLKPLSNPGSPKTILSIFEAQELHTARNTHHRFKEVLIFSLVRSPA